MKDFIEIIQAFLWFALCVVAAVTLLAASVIFSLYLSVRRNVDFRRIELPKIQLAR